MCQGIQSKTNPPCNNAVEDEISLGSTFLFANSARASASARAGVPRTAVTIHTDIDWDSSLAALDEVDARLSAWAAAAARQTRAALLTLGVDDLPVTVVHGDFAEWNVHYDQGKLAGIVDFGLTHLDSRPHELADARAWRAPEMMDSYRHQLLRSDQPLTELEEILIEPIYRAFRVEMVAWELSYGRKTDNYDLEMIERQLSRTGSAPG